MNLDLMREAGSVERYHTSRTLRRQTLAEHQWGVAMVLLHLYPQADACLISMALTHDVEELFTGDSPAPAKWEHAPLAEALTEFERKVWPRFELDFEPNMLSCEETQLLKFCDGVELVQWCIEEGKLGNRYAHLPALRVLERLYAMCEAGVWLCPVQALELYKSLMEEYRVTFG